MIDDPAIYVAWLLLAYSSSFSVHSSFFHLFPVYLYLSQNNAVAWNCYHAIFSLEIALSFVILSLLFAYHELKRIIETTQLRNIITLLSVAVSFSGCFI